jgi:hypothetical protein
MRDQKKNLGPKKNTLKSKNKKNAFVALLSRYGIGLRDQMMERILKTAKTRHCTHLVLTDKKAALLRRARQNYLDHHKDPYGNCCFVLPTWKKEKSRYKVTIDGRDRMMLMSPLEILYLSLLNDQDADVIFTALLSKCNRKKRAPIVYDCPCRTAQNMDARCANPAHACVRRPEDDVMLIPDHRPIVKTNPWTITKEELELIGNVKKAYSNACKNAARYADQDILDNHRYGFTYLAQILVPTNGVDGFCRTDMQRLRALMHNIMDSLNDMDPHELILQIPPVVENVVFYTPDDLEKMQEYVDAHDAEASLNDTKDDAADNAQEFLDEFERSVPSAETIPADLTTLFSTEDEQLATCEDQGDVGAVDAAEDLALVYPYGPRDNHARLRALLTVRKPAGILKRRVRFKDMIPCKEEKDVKLVPIKIDMS